MNFKEAIEALTPIMGAKPLADALGYSVQTIRQMRSDPDKVGYRRPPEDWAVRLRPVAEEAYRRTGRAVVAISSLAARHKATTKGPDTDR